LQSIYCSSYISYTWSLFYILVHQVPKKCLRLSPY